MAHALHGRTGRPLYYFLLWLVPLFTSFSFFMILRQMVQHGNGDRGWLTNTRIFFVDRFINFAVFPMGQDYHLPHHLFATVPHYRLKRAARDAAGVPGVSRAGGRGPRLLLAAGASADPPDRAGRAGAGVRRPASSAASTSTTRVLEDCVVEEKEQILAEGEQEAKRLA